MIKEEDKIIRRVNKKNGNIGNPEEYPSEDGNKNQSSLQAEKTDSSRVYSFYTGIRRVFFWISEKKRISGSITVEAAVVIPVFLLAVSTILGILDIYRIQALVKNSLHQSALELGMYAYAAESGQDSPVGLVSSGVCAMYAKSKMPDLGRYVSVSTAGSAYDNKKVKLRARIEYKIPLSILPLPVLHFTNESQVNSWVGRIAGDGDGESNGTWEQMVYVSEYESVYHTSSSCTHLDLTIHRAEADQVKNLRNIYGGRYHSCEKCGKSSSDGETVYYTEKGDCFHTQENCSGLKRSVRLVKKSETVGERQCQRCQAKEGS